CMAFAPDGMTLATGHADGTVLLWDMASSYKKLTGGKERIDAVACWADLAQADPRKGYAAVDRLASAPAEALPLLRQRIVPVKVEPCMACQTARCLGQCLLRRA